MNIRKIALLLSLFTTAAALANLPPGLKPVDAGAMREAAGYSVRVPGKGWLESKQEGGALFFKRIDATESYHAGLRVGTDTAFANQAAFNEAARAKLLSDTKNPRYKILRNEIKEGERAGHWTVTGRIDFDDTGAVNVGKHGALSTLNAHLIMVDPKQPSQLVVVWFSWRGVKKNEAEFQAEADRFFDSLQTPPTPVGR